MLDWIVLCFTDVPIRKDQVNEKLARTSFHKLCDSKVLPAVHQVSQHPNKPL